MKKTLADTINPVPEPARHHLLDNIYDLTADTAMLHEAYNMVTGFNNQEDFVFGYASELANVKIDAGDLDSARYYLNVARSLSDVCAPRDDTLLLRRPAEILSCPGKQRQRLPLSFTQA